MAVVPDRIADSCVTIAPAAAAGGTITLPAISGFYHYIYAITAQRTVITAAIVGTGALSITTTNIAGNPQWQVGNAVSVGASLNDIMLTFSDPLKSQVAGTATTIVFPAAGANTTWVCNCWYTVDR